VFTVYIRAIGRPFEDHAQTVVDHLRIIANLHDAEPSQNTPPEGSPCETAGHDLLKYVIAASFKKMHARLKPSNKYSADFVNTLLYLENHWDHYNPSPPSTPAGQPKYSALDEDFLSMIAEPDMLDNLSIPHLMDLATEFLGDCDRKAVRHLYTQDTYREIHHLLCQLLTSYQEGLRVLNEFEKSKGAEALTERVLDVAAAGLCLHTMAYGSVLERHFERMSDILSVIMQSKPWVKTTAPNDSKERAHPPESESQDADPESSQDSELIAVQPKTKLTETDMITTSQSFHKWSRLMVSYFESYKIVVNYVKERSLSLSLTIVKIPHQGQQMTTWSDLADGPYDIVSAKLPTSPAPFEGFLRFALPDKSVVDPTSDAAWAAQLKAITNAEDFRRAIRYIQTVHSSLTEFFCDTAPLSTGDGFKGTVHCEAGLASLAYARDTDYRPLGIDLWFSLVC
jgi:hypothetical protein